MSKTVQLAEKQLLLLLQQKNERAFSYLYDQYAPVLYGLIVREVKNEKLASEVLKRTFLNIARQCHDIGCIKKSLFSWLLTLTRKTASIDFNVDITFTSLTPNLKLKTDKPLQNQFSGPSEYGATSYQSA